MKKLLRSVFVFVLAFSLVLGTGAFTNVGTINVNAATAQVKITPNSKTIYVGKTTKLKVKKKAKKAKLTWKSSNKRVATVNKKGVVTGRAAGKATIQLKMKVGKKVYRGKSKITVKPILVKSISTSAAEKSMKPGEKYSLRVSVSPSDATNKSLKYSSSNTAVASVDGAGIVTAKKGGKATIYVETKDGSNKKIQVKVSVSYSSANTGKVRTVVTTDGEVDDMDSFMRLMLYSNEMDIAGLILSSSTYHYAGGTMKDGTVVKPYRWTGTKWASEVLDNYAKVYPNLRANAKGYPEPDYLKSILKIGNIKNVGDMEESTDGSNFLKDILLDNDNRTLYIQTWGGTNTTARALYDIEQQYKDKANWKEIYNKVCDKAVIYIILNQDDTFSKYIAKNWPDIKIIQDGGNFWRFAYMWKRVDASLTTRLQGKWYYNNIAKGHGALLSGYHLMGDGTILDGELDNEQRGSEEYLINNPNYNRYDFISEGDSPSFFYLLDTGLRSMEDPTYGGWGGRFGVDTDGNYRNIVSDKFNGKDDTTYTLTRWFDDIQDDFAARADWCISSDYSKSNHRPTVKVREGIDLTAKPGERIKLHADATDPDGDGLDYNWWQYYEADTYNGSEDGEISMVGKESDTMSFVVPEDAQDGDTIHMVITVKDDGAHNMTHYQRVIVKVQGRQEIDTLSLELPEGKDANAIETGSYSGWSNPYAFTITAKASNKDGQAIANKTMTWESSDEAVGTVNSKGVFTPKKAGKTTITATANDGSGKTATIELTVVEK